MCVVLFFLGLNLTKTKKGVFLLFLGNVRHSLDELIWVLFRDLCKNVAKFERICRASWD